MKKLIVSAIILVLLILPCGANESETKITYRRVENSEMKIALTFDDGPHPYYTEKILGILEKYNVKATFFFVGQNIGYYPEAAEKVYLSGHEIGNHTFTHKNVDSMPRGELFSELGMCDDAIYEIDEYCTRLFRPPQGTFDEQVESAARSMDYSIILWSIDTRDWEHRSSENIAETVINNVKSGDIILMHDYIGRNSPTPEALEIMIPKLLELGYKFVSVSELMNS